MLSTTEHADPASDPDGAVTYSVRWAARPGHEAGFMATLNGMVHAASAFPGHLGVNVFGPSDHQRPEFHIVIKFDALTSLQHWLASDVRRDWLARAAGDQVGPPAIEVLSGLETWFALPDQSGPPSLPRWKMALVSWLAIFPLITAFRLVLSPVLAGMSVWLQSLLLTALLTPTMTWIVMPAMTRLFRRFLYPLKRP